MNILVVEDETKIRDVLTLYFTNEGWTVFAADNGQEALSLFRSISIDLVVLDLMLDGMQGEELCKSIRNVSNVPLLMLTAKSLESDVVAGLNLGADYYITKPFRVKEIVAQIHAFQRRIASQAAVEREAVTFNRRKLVVRPGAQDVLVEGKPALLTTTEFRVLGALLERAGSVVSRADLNYKATGYRFPEDVRTIDAHIKNIRKKIERDPKQPEYVLTKVGSGYMFAFPPDEE